MVIYEVNLAIAPGRVNEYSAWLEEHVREMLALDGFESAALYARSGTSELPPSPGGAGRSRADGNADDETADAPERVPEGDRHWTVHYHLESREALDRYFEEDAERMRAKGDDQFEEVHAERRVLESRKVFSHQER